jgi:hypothetical protein
LKLKLHNSDFSVSLNCGLDGDGFEKEKKNVKKIEGKEMKKEERLKRREEEKRRKKNEGRDPNRNSERKCKL